MVGFWHGCKSGTQNVLNETLVFVVNEVRDNFHNLECHKIIYCHWDGITLSATGRLLWNPQCGWPDQSSLGSSLSCGSIADLHCEPASPSSNSRAGPCRESWEMIEGNPLNLKIGKMWNKAVVLPCSSWRKRRPDVSDERFRGSVGGRLEGLWRRWGRYGTAEGQGGVESASARAVCQAGEQLAVARWSAHNKVAGGLTTIWCNGIWT